MSNDENTHVLKDENVQRLAHMIGHIINIFKAVNKIENVMESIELCINKVEEDIKATKDDIEALKECFKWKQRLLSSTTKAFIVIRTF
jgi:hypothetical protein